jgi:hypothetical protein
MNDSRDCVTRPADDARRRFVKTLGGALGVFVLARAARREARADDLPHLSTTDPTAQALGYVEDTNQADSAKYPNHKPDQDCANCNFYQGAAGAEYGPCQLFPGKSVHAKGWCSAHAAKKG